MLLLAFRRTHTELGATFVPMQIERYEGKALAFDGTYQSIEFLAM